MIFYYKTNIVPIFIITELYLLANTPYIVGVFWNISNIYITSAVYILFLIYWISTKVVHNQLLPQKINFPFFVTIFTWGLYAILHNDSSYVTRIILLTITYLFLLALYRKSLFVKFWKYNNYFILLQAGASLIGFISVAIGLLHPLGITTVSNDIYENNIYFFGFCFSKTYIGDLIRPSGFFDEPGALAAWSIYSLMLNYAFIKDKYINKYLPFFTVVTLSMAYFIQMASYYILVNYTKIYKIIYIGALVLIAIYYINTTKNTSFDLYAKTIARFEYSQESMIEGNNREIQMENAQKLFLQSPIVGVGGQTLGQLDKSTSDNPYEILAKDGIIGFIISYLPLIMVLLNNKRKEVLICVVVVAIGYLQRPLHINFIHNMYIWSLLLFALEDANNNRKAIRSLSKPSGT